MIEMVVMSFWIYILYVIEAKDWAYETGFFVRKRGWFWEVLGEKDAIEGTRSTLLSAQRSGRYRIWVRLKGYRYSSLRIPRLDLS